MNYFLGNSAKQKIPVDRNKNDNIILFTNARDEKKIMEWVAHHLVLGFTCIYIFDHKSIVPLKKVFHHFHRRVFVERCELSIPPKIPLMNRAASIAKSMNMDWMIYLDADEYLYIANPFNLKTMLRRFSFADSLAINWLMYGTNHHKKEPQEGLLIENYTKSELSFDKHVKTFVRPHCIKKVVTPHYYDIYHQERMFSIDGKRMDPPFSFHKNMMPFTNSYAFIAHYIYQSEEKYMQRKIKMPQDDNGTKRNIDKELHTRFNNCDNHLMREKYSHLIKQFLSRKNISNSI